MTDGEDYFQLFGLPRAYEIDQGTLDAAYERLSFEHHPDFFAAAAPEEQARAERAAAELNKAYAILSTPESRAEYLLELLAVGSELDPKQLPEGFLAEMFVLQEEVDEAADEPQRVRLAGRVDAALQEARVELQALFGDVLETPRSEILQAIQTNLNCEKYLLRIHHRLTETGSA